MPPPHGQYGVPAAGYGPPPHTPPGPGRNSWIIGISALVVVVVVAVVAVVLSGSGDDTTPGADSGPGATEQAPAHPWSHVAEACDLLDQSVITRWVPEGSKPPSQSLSLRPHDTSAADLRCMYWNGYNSNDEPQDSWGTLELRAELADATHNTSFADWKKNWIDDNSAEAVMTGPVPDLGGEAYYSHFRIDHEAFAGLPSSQSIRHVLIAKDGNLAVQVQLDLTLSEQPHADDQEIAAAVRGQLEKAFAALRK